MDAQLSEARPPEFPMSGALTADEAIASWHDQHKAPVLGPDAEPLLAASELHGVMPRARARRPRAWMHAVIPKRPDSALG